jgi:signal transducing adaptor molecule
MWDSRHHSPPTSAPSYPITFADRPAAKATDENLASEDWDVNLQICDKVSEDGTDG